MVERPSTSPLAQSLSPLSLGVSALCFVRVPDVLAAGGLAPLVLAFAVVAWVSIEPAVLAPWQRHLHAAMWTLTAAAMAAPALAHEGVAAVLGTVATLFALGPWLGSATPVAVLGLAAALAATAWAHTGPPWTLLEPRWAEVARWSPHALVVATAAMAPPDEAPSPRRDPRRAPFTLSITLLAAVLVAAAWWPGAGPWPVGAAFAAAAVLPLAVRGGVLPLVVCLLWFVGPGAAGASWWLTAGWPLALGVSLAASGGGMRIGSGIGLIAASAVLWTPPATVTEAVLTGALAVALSWWVAWQALREVRPLGKPTGSAA